MTRLLTLTSLLIAFSAGPTLADNVVLEPVADAYVWSYTPNTNYGSSPTLYVGRDGLAEYLESLVRFDISIVPDGADINFAYFDIWCNIFHGTPQYDMSCDDANTDWDEYSVTWNNAPDPYGDIETAPWPSSGEWVAFEVTDFVQYWVDGDRVNHGFLVYTIYIPFMCYGNFSSRQNSDEDERPMLHIDYTPSAVTETSFGAIKAAFK